TKKVLHTSAKHSQPEHPTTLTQQQPGTARTSQKSFNPESLSIQDPPTRFFTKNVLTRLPEALPGPGKDQPPPQPSFPYNPHQPDEPRHLSRLPLDPAEQRRL